jgi:hypothetical protein
VLDQGRDVSFLELIFFWSWGVSKRMFGAGSLLWVRIALAVHDFFDAR